MTFEEYWHSEYPPLYEVGKAVARAAWEAASLDADEARAELDTRRENLELCQKRLITTETERNTYRDALEEIRTRYGHVCTEFELCEHPACESSYGAWAVADEALRGVTWVTDEPVNQYTPWIELGISETQYYKRRYLEMSHENARLTELLEETSLRVEVENWLKMLSTEIFQEPDFVKARALLVAGGMTLDGLSASNMRHVLTRLIDHDDKARAARVQAAAPGTGEGG